MNWTGDQHCAQQAPVFIEKVLGNGTASSDAPPRQIVPRKGRPVPTVQHAPGFRSCDGGYRLLRRLSARWPVRSSGFCDDCIQVEVAIAGGEVPEWRSLSMAANVASQMMKAARRHGKRSPIPKDL